MKNYEPRSCVICGAEYIPKRSDQRCCGSYECKKGRQRLDYMERRKEKCGDRYCTVCGKPFIPRRINQMTCASAECKAVNAKRLQMEWRKKNRGSSLEANRKYMRERRHQEYQPKPDTIVAIGYAERQMAASLAKAGKVKVKL